MALKKMFHLKSGNETIILYILPMDSGDVSSLLLLSCSLRKETLDWSYFKGTAAFAFFRRLFFLSALALQLQKK